MSPNRRQFLGGGLVGASMLLGGCSARSSGSSASSTTTAPRALRQPGSRPFPDLPVGTDQVPQIEHFVVVMMENHSFDNIWGSSAAGTGSRSDPTANRPPRTRTVTATTCMPSTCRPSARPSGVSNDWTAAHEAYDNGTCQGFVTSTTAEAMGYFTSADLPFTCGMAKTFPIADRYFCSAMAQTVPESPVPDRGHLARSHRRHLPFGAAAQRRDLRAIQQARHHLEGLLHDAADPRESSFRCSRTTPCTPGLVTIDEFFTDAAAGNAPGVQPAGARLRRPVRRGSPRRPVRRPIHGPGRQCRDVESQLAPPC